MTEELPLCACGCGERVTKACNRFINGHQNRGVPKSSEHCAKLSATKTGENNPMFGKTHLSETIVKISKALMGVPKSTAACAAMSKANKGTPRTSLAQMVADKANADKQRGGHDLVDHHMIYDHSDLSKNIMRMTRSMHMKLHQLFRKHGIEIPHINKEV